MIKQSVLTQEQENTKVVPAKAETTNTSLQVIPASQVATKPTTLKVGNLEFELRYSSRRRTIEVIVDRGGELVIAAPEDCPLEIIERIARQKSEWLYNKLEEKELLFQPGIAKEYVSGEGFFYLGRSYRLRVVNSIKPAKATVTSLAHRTFAAQTEIASEPDLVLRRGWFRLSRLALTKAENVFIEWYTRQGTNWISNRLENFTNRLEAVPLEVRVQDLGFRWASCSPQNGRLNFHWRCMLLPANIIDYIIVHELVHFHEPHHNNDFWRRVERAMPDYIPRKEWLARNGSGY